MTELNSHWEKDIALDSFEMRRLKFPNDYAGEVVASLVRRKLTTNSKKAVLYIHGYMDYFFQSHLAEAYLQTGFNFYALDLRKYGRSLRAGQDPNFCKDIREYFAEITESIRIIREEEGNDYLVVNGHSTGALSSSLYATTGERRQQIDALILNSPFFAFNVEGALKLSLKVLSWLASLNPYLGLQGKDLLPYIQSIHKNYHGEWDFSLEWRKAEGFPIYSGWVRAITKAHEEVRKGLDIQCPVLVLHSDKSIYGTKYSPEFQTGDAVLNVEHIKAGSKHLGKNVQVVEIKDGLHDLVLSRKDVREEYLQQVLSFLESIQEKVAASV